MCFISKPFTGLDDVWFVCFNDSKPTYNMGDISGSYGGKYEDDCLLGCCAV
jgi:hypothetical protein